jgi:hypothetical protein
MKFPYGMSDFETLIKEHYFYVDRTDRLPLLEDTGKQLLFLRPRRFGKSLLLSMLENYYDLAKASQFDQLFGHLAIGKNPTLKHNQYFVMTWDFSRVESHTNLHDLRRAVHQHLNDRIQSATTKYQAWLPQAIQIYPDYALSSFESLLTAIQQTPYQLYLLIDEYDNFANQVLMGHGLSNPQHYQNLVSGEGVLKTVFSAVKAASAGRGLDKVFITGVSPLVMSDMTSGYNVAVNIYLEPDLNDLCGFTAAEVQTTVAQLVTNCQLPAATANQVVSLMQTFYNGYRFCRYDTTPLVYNPTLALYFWRYFQKSCHSPEKMLDSNLAMDQNKLAYIASLPLGSDVIREALLGLSPLMINELSDRFSLTDLLKPNPDRSFMVSLLYYFGVLTLVGQTPLHELLFTIPNLVIRKLYVEQLHELAIPEDYVREMNRQVARQFYRTGDLQPVCELLEQSYFSVFDNRDYRTAGELTVKMAFVMLLFDDLLYIMDSETKIGRGYGDLTLIIRPDLRQAPLWDILFELKYVKLKKQGKLTAVAVKAKSAAELKALPVVQEQFLAARAQLQRYRAILEEEYPEVLRLRTYAVVAVGLERVVWEEVLAP